MDKNILKNWNNLRKILSLIIFTLILIFPVYMALANNQEFLPEEKVLIEKIKNNKATSKDLAELRLKYAAETFKKWKETRNKKDYEKALVYANSAIELDSKNAKAFALLGLIYSQVHTNKDALKLATNAYAESLNFEPANTAVQLQLADVLVKQKRYWSAIEMYEDLFIKSESMISGINTVPLALCYIADGRVEAGIMYFGELENKYPKNAGVLLPYSVLLKNSGQEKLAVKKLKKVLKIKAGENQKAYAKKLLVKWEEAK